MPNIEVTLGTLIGDIKFEFSYGEINTYGVLSIFISIITIIFAIIFYKTPLFLLNENQLLYIYSTSAQVIAGLFGLTFTGFIFFEAKLKDKIEENDSYYDHVESLKRIYHRDILSIGAVSFISIILCIFTIAFNGSMMFTPFANGILLSLTISLVISSIFSIIQFCIKLMDPKKVESISKNMSIRVINDLSNNQYKANVTGADSLRTFLDNYIELEENIINFATECYRGIQYNNDVKNKPRIIEALNILYKNEYLSADEVDEINKLRIYRNALVHGKNIELNQNISKLLNKYNNDVAKYYKSNIKINERTS